MSRRLRLLAAAAVAIAAAVLAAVWAGGLAAGPDLSGAIPVARPPRIHPDYSGTVIPPNIAPLNFAVREDGRRFFVRIRSESGPPIEIAASTPQVRIPGDRWRALLEANAGKALCFDVYAEEDGLWRQYGSIANTIARDPIDSHLVYRLIRPLYSEYRNMAIQQRDLTNFRESVVLDGKSLEGGCVNCHSFAANRPDPMLIGVRSAKYGQSTLLAGGDHVEKITAKFGFTAWHPTGRVVAYSINESVEFFHAVGRAMRDVIDLDAGLAYYRVEARTTRMVPRASDDQRLESHPTWSPDGRYLYYSSAPNPWKDGKAQPPEGYENLRYDLMRIRYDLEADRWGDPETVLSSRKTGLSILLPRISPDGRFLLFCMCPHGSFPAFCPQSDLYLMDLGTGLHRRLDINSDASESWHSWSSNGRWIAFSSKRGSDPFTRCYLSFVAETGKVHKPLVLPQRDPESCDSFLRTFSVPELVAGPISVPGEALSRTARLPSE